MQRLSANLSERRRVLCTGCWERLIPRAATSLAAVALMAGIAGCSGAPPLKQVLLAPPQASQVARQGANWQVARVKVPDYLDSYHIRYRASDFVIDELADAKWAQRLPAGVTALLQSAIDSSLKQNRHRPYTVHVDISTFAPQPSGKVVLSAHWRVTNRQSHETVAQNAAVINKPLAVKKRSPEAIGRTMSQAVRTLAQRIVSTAG